MVFPVWKIPLSIAFLTSIPPSISPSKAIDGEIDYKIDGRIDGKTTLYAHKKQSFIASFGLSS